MASRTTIDPIEILLEMGVDLDNLSTEEDYLSALMEAAAIIEFQTKGSGDKRSVILRKEIIAVRKKRKAADKNFKARKTTVSASSFKKGTAAAGRQKALPSAIKPKTSIIPYTKFNEVDEEEGGKKARTRKKTDKDQNLLQGIAKSVSNIADIMKKQYALKKKKGAYDRKRAEAEKRKLKESNLEKRYKGLASAAEKIIAPVKGALDSILDFFLNIIIGRFLVKFIRWFGDPKNKKKVDSVIRFLVDHGPKLLAAFLLFGTSIGRFAVRMSALLLKGALKIGAAAAKFAIKFAIANPAAAAITAIVGGTAIGAIMQANTQSNDPDAPEGRTQLEDTMDYGGVTGDPFAGAFQYGGTIPYYNEGGGVSSGKITTNSGNDITGAGADTQLIAAQPGEIVINKRTVDAVGADHFLGLNRQYGGPNANKPKTATVQTASGGGVVLPAFSNGGQVGSGDESNSRPRGKQRTPDVIGTLRRIIPAIGEKFPWAKKLIDPAFYGRVGGEAQRMSQPTIDRAMRVGGEAQKMFNSGFDRAMRVGGEAEKVIKEKIHHTVEGTKAVADAIINQDYAGMFNSVKNMYGAAEEAVPALIGGAFGMDRVDRHISKDMQRAILDAKKTAEARGAKDIDYGDYEGGGLSAAGLTMGRVGDQEFKRDAQGRIIGLTQTFDTNRPAEEAMLQAQIAATKFLGIDNTNATNKLRKLITDRMKSEGASPEEIKNATKYIKPGGEAYNVKDAARAIYKPFEALLDTVQGRGTTTHDVMFDKDVLGFDPVEAPPKPGSPNYQLFKDGGGLAAMSQGKTVRQVVDAGRSANSTNPIMDFLGLSKSKPTTNPETTKKTGTQPYFSSTTGKFYASYAEALKDPQVAAAARLEKTKASLSFPTPSMTMPGPPPGGGNNVKIVRVSSPGGGDNPVDKNVGGSDVNAASTGNGNKAKWNILGIPMPF